MIDFARLQAFLQIRIGQNELKHYLIALGVFLFVVVLLQFVKFAVIKRLAHMAKRTETRLDDVLVYVIDRIGWPFFVSLGLYSALYFIAIPSIITQVVFVGFIIISTYYGIHALRIGADYTLGQIIEKRRRLDPHFDSTVLQLMGKMVKGALWAIGIILILQNIGYDISALIAGFGIGGVAIAFALQNVLGDILAAVALYLDKPFQVGDFIVIGADKGVVKKIGIKSTRVQTVQGQELIISNKELTTSRVQNFKRMQQRTVSFSVGVPYGTSLDKLKKLPELIRKVITDIESCTFEGAHFTTFGDGSLIFEVTYELPSSEFEMYQKVQEQINFVLKEAFDKEGIEIVYAKK